MAVTEPKHNIAAVLAVMSTKAPKMPLSQDEDASEKVTVTKAGTAWQPRARRPQPPREHVSDGTLVNKINYRLLNVRGRN